MPDIKTKAQQMHLVDVSVQICTIVLTILVHVLPHGKVAEGNIYLFDSTNCDYYARPTVWDKYWAAYSVCFTLFWFALALLTILDTPVDIAAFRWAVVAACTLFMLVCIAAHPLVHELHHSAILDTSGNTPDEHEVRTRIGPAVRISLFVPFLVYAKHIAALTTTAKIKGH